MSTDTRIATLESQVRTLKRMLFGVFGVVVVGGLLAATSLQSVPDVIQAKKFEVVNGEGKVIVELSNLSGGGVDNGMLVTRNSAGKTLVILAASSAGGMVITENGKGKRLVQLTANSYGHGLVRTENGEGGILVDLASTSEGSGMIATENGNGGVLVKLSAGGPGIGTVTTKNGKGQTVVELTASMELSSSGGFDVTGLVSTESYNMKELQR